MSHYKSNLRDIEFNLFEVFGAQNRLGTGPYADLDPETARDILGEVERLATGPLPATGRPMATTRAANGILPSPRSPRITSARWFRPGPTTCARPVRSISSSTLATSATRWPESRVRVERESP